MASKKGSSTLFSLRRSRMNGFIRVRRGPAVVVLAALISVGMLLPGYSSAMPQADGVTANLVATDKIVEDHNKARKEVGIPALSWDYKLAGAASSSNIVGSIVAADQNDCPTGPGVVCGTPDQNACPPGLFCIWDETWRHGNMQTMPEDSIGHVYLSKIRSTWNRYVTHYGCIYLDGSLPDRAMSAWRPDTGEYLYDNGPISVDRLMFGSGCG